MVALQGPEADGRSFGDCCTTDSDVVFATKGDSASEPHGDRVGPRASGSLPSRK